MKRRFYTILYKTAALLSISLLAAFHYSKPMCALRALPQTIRISDAQRLTEIFPASNAAALRVDAQTAERISDVSDTLYTFRLFGRIPLKTVKVVRTDDVRLIPGGSAVGITLHTAGVLLVGLGAVETEEGLQSPAAAAGLAAGDLIVSANGETVQSARHFSALSAASGGKLSLIVRRGDATLAFTVFPV
ncbi:MAG: PDZ domain-containing protein, partial [Christensenellales bacterium]